MNSTFSLRSQNKSTDARKTALKLMTALALSSSLFANFALAKESSKKASKTAASQEQTSADASDDTSREDLTNAVSLNPTFRVHTSPDANSNSVGTLSRSEIVSAERMEDHKSAHVSWVKVTRKDGSVGYVRGGTIHTAVLGGNYVVRENPSLTGKRIGTVDQVSKKSELILTGKSKTVSENGKTVKWLEAIHNGKSAWVASNAVKSVDAERSATTKIAKASTPKSESPKNPPLPPVKPKTSKKLVAVQVPDDVPSKIPGKIVPPPKPTTKGPQPKKLVTKNSPAPTGSTTQTDIVCVKTRAEFKASAAMKKAFGSSYDPFVSWTDDTGSIMGKLEFLPQNDSEGTWILQSADGPKNNPIAKIPAQVCVDQSGKHRFVSALGQQIDLRNKDQITVDYQGQSFQFNRTTK